MRSFLAILTFALGTTVSAAESPSGESLALRILDGEALYTVSGGLKPVSDGFWQTRFPATQQTSDEVADVRRALAALTLGPDLEAGVYVFASTFNGQRTASAFIAHKPKLKELIERRKDAFEPIGVTPLSSPQQVMEKIDRAARSARWRAFGLVFGYPDYAVDFFVAAGEKQDETGKFVERDFVPLPTFASDTGRFVYAVPKGHFARDEDRVLKDKVLPIFERYLGWRICCIGEGKPGAIAMLQYWISPPACPEPVRICTTICQPRRPLFDRMRHR